MPGVTQIPNSSNNNLSEQIAKPAKLKDQRDAKQKRNEWRITKMVLAIFLSFVACYLPITITKVVDKDVNWPGLHIFGYIMIYLSASVNPIIYVIMNKQYRQAYKTVLLCKATRLLSFAGGHGSSMGGKFDRRPTLSPNFLIIFGDQEGFKELTLVKLDFIKLY